MNIFRTTVNFDSRLHRQLAMKAAAQGVSLSQLINQLLANKNSLCLDLAQKSYQEDARFFSSLSKKRGKTDWGKTLRTERNRDHD